MNSHIFSLYNPEFFKILPTVNQNILVSDVQIVHRMVKVLRYCVQDYLIFFDRQYHAKVQILQISKKNITVLVLEVNQNKTMSNHVTFLLPLLKRDALEQAVYSLCELGVSVIQLVVTEKSRKNLMNDKEFERLEAIVIAAAEQSKHYAMSFLFKPKNILENFELHEYDQKIVFDVSGTSFFDIKRLIHKKIVLVVGPEAGLTNAEMQNLQTLHFESCVLTQTTLRAVQAVALAAGLFLVR